QPVDRKLISSPDKECILAGPVEVLNLDSGIAGVSAPWAAQVGISSSGESVCRCKQRLLEGELRFEAKLLDQKKVALQELVSDTALIHELGGKPGPYVGTNRELHFPFGVSDI